MASITTWTRLETRQRTDDLDVTLAARVHDPLWLLARQWQMGEFRGHDSGSPVEVSMRAATGHLDRYVAGLPGEDATQRSRSYDDVSLPLEGVVEAEPLTPRTAPRLMAEAGAHFLRFLRAANLDRYRDPFVAAFTPTVAPDAGRDAAGARFHDLVVRQVPDGLALREALLSSGDVVLPDQVGVEPADVEAVIAVVRRWLTWFDAIVPAPNDEAWVPERLEHSFAVAATVDGAEHVLVSREYSSGRLDWHDFDVAGEGSLGSTEESEVVVRTVLPAPVTYPGMPAPRWWEFEDAKVDLGAIDAGADDIARMLMVGFAVDYGNDWFVVPIDLAVGSLTKIETLRVTDTFGVRTRIRSAADIDGEGARWRMYQLTGAGAGDEADELLFLPPVIATNLDGPVRERVSIVRDEVANLTWAIEDTVESATGLPRRRDEEPQPPGPPLGMGGPLLRYQVATDVASAWHPLVAVGADTGGVRLEQRELHPAAGTILGADVPLRVFEEEIPGEGLSIERTFQLARWLHGGTALWSARRRSSGRGPTASGHRFDDVRRTDT